MSGAQFKAGAVPLSEMDDYAFWSRDVIGATPEDCEAAINGSLTPERREYLACAGMAARDELLEMKVPGVKFWMSDARRAN